MSTYDIIIYAGSTFTLPITIQNKSCKTGIDLSSATITLGSSQGSNEGLRFHVTATAEVV